MFFRGLRTQTRLILLLTLTVGLFVTMVLVQVKTSQDRVRDFITKTRAEKKIIFDNIMTLKGEAVATLANDYTYWDDMVKFVETADKTWAKENIDVALDTYKVDAEWVYGKDFSLIYAVNGFEDTNFAEAPFPKSKEIFEKLFKQDGLCYFFVDTPHGLLEIRGATIHPTADSERKTPAHGYFFVGRIWDDKYMHAFSSLISGTISLLPKDYAGRLPDNGKNMGNRVSFIEELEDWEGKPVRAIFADFPVPLAKEVIQGFRQNLAIQIIFLFSSLFIVLIALNRWVNDPLQAIAATLKTENLAPIESIQKQKGEFADIAKLIVKFMDQRQKLIDDIAARKAAETALIKSEERFRNIAEISREWIWETDAAGRYTYSSAIVSELLGYFPGEIIGRHFSEFLSPSEGKIIETKAKEIFQQKGEFYRMENRNLHRDGHPVMLETTAVPICNLEGELVGYRGVDRDITRERKRQEELQETSTQLRTIIDSVDEGIIFSDTTGHFLVYNSKMEEITGYSMDEANRSKNFMALLYPKPEDYQEAMGRLAAITQDKVYPEAETVIQAKNGQDKIVLVRTRKLTIKGTTMFLTVYRDVTKRKQVDAELVKANEELLANERALKNILVDLKRTYDELKNTQTQLVQSEKMAAVGQLSAGVAHEIKNPLSIILLSVDALREAVDKFGPQDQKKLDMIRNSAERANKVISDLLKFSRYSTLDLKPENLIPIIDDAVALVQNTAVIKRVEIKKEYPPHELVLVAADQILLQQVLLNLFSNALDAMNDGGSLGIKINFQTDPKNANKKEVVVDIQDTGSGIPRPILSRIFEPFFTTKEPNKGTGLGLSIVYMIIERHGGRIAAESKEGEGSKFSIILPLLPTPGEKLPRA